MTFEFSRSDSLPGICFFDLNESLIFRNSREKNF
uniref:Uncharacterized protein n=1 Tax=Rhizophora mucronata TaxID=61149 RepID=A0A2P2PZD8_RHIMU